MNSLSVLCLLLVCLMVIESARIDKLGKKAKDKKKRQNIEKMLADIGKGKHKSKDSKGNGLHKIQEKRDRNGNKVSRIVQEYDDLPVVGFEIVERETSGQSIAEISKATGKPTGRKFRPRKSKKRSGKFVLDLEEDLGKIDKTKLKPGEALSKLKEKRGKGKKIRNEQAESIIFVEEATGRAQIAYAASLYGEDDDGPVYPVVISDTDGNVLLEYDNIQHQSIVEKGTGPGGNEKIGCYNFGSNKDKLSVSELPTGKCRYDTGNVKVVHLHNSYSNDDNTPFEYDCYHQDSDAVNGGCSPLNDALHFGNKIYEMFNKWYGKAPLTTPLYMKVHYKDNYQNAFWDGSAMTFGDGASRMHPLVSLDVTAHEVAHGVTTQSSNLIYSGQSGGLNEAFSDMAGKAAERYVRGYGGASFNWGIGSDIFKGDGSLRCMDNPPCDSRSIDHVSKYYNVMDVHYSSGIFNKVFYRLSTKFDNDIWDAFDLFYIANTKFWGQNTNFVDAAELTLEAMDEMKQAKHLPYDYNWINSQDIVDAFAEVGISCSKSGTAWDCT